MQVQPKEQCTQPDKVYPRYQTSGMGITTRMSVGPHALATRVQANLATRLRNPVNLITISLVRCHAGRGDGIDKLICRACDVSRYECTIARISYVDVSLIPSPFC